MTSRRPAPLATRAPLPARRLPRLAAALNIDGPDILAATGGYIGDIPIVAGGLLYVYDPEAGGIGVYNAGAGTPHPLAKIPGIPGHWNSPIVVDGHVVEPEGDANAHSLTGTLDLFSAGAG